jgi:peptidoglycan/LPS O-acetylase OafA/YrhL
VTYRPEIDGLRAIAVMAVVLFHLGIEPLAGGFVGVDVFFVISGYLITQLILARVARGDFSLAGFYLRRIRRLLPPLLATVAATFAAAALLLNPYDFAPFARSALAAMVSVSNIVFYAEAGYWDADSELKPLLHTWSLGVEEQFYLAWPALLLLLWRSRGRLPLGASLGGLAVVSAGVTVWYTGVDASAAFFLSPFRVFQFATGAALPFLLATGPGGRLGARAPVARGALALGLLLVLASVLGLDGDTLYPGWAALVPTLGAALALLGTAAPGAGGPLLRALCHPLSTWLGKVSYALYLVHWPVVALYRYHTGSALAPLEQLALGAAMLLLAWVLHAGIERRFYSRAGDPGPAARLPDGRFALAVAGLVAVLAAPALHAWLGDGWGWRYPRQQLSAAAIEAGEQRRFLDSRSACNLRVGTDGDCAGAPIQVLVLGNSHEVDGYNFLRAIYENDPEVALVLFGGTEKCGRLRVVAGTVRAQYPACTERFAALMTPEVAQRFHVVAVSASNRAFSRIAEPFLVATRALREYNPALRVMTFGSYMKTRVPCARLINETGISAACGRPENLDYFEADPARDRLFEPFMAITDLYIDRVDLLCSERRPERCRTETPDGVPAFFDKHHHSRAFARYSGERFAEVHPDPVRALLGAGAPGER